MAPKASNLLKVQQLSGKIVGVQLGSIQEKNIKEIAKKVTGIQIKQLNRVSEAIQELKSKRIDAAIIENTVAEGFARSVASRIMFLDQGTLAEDTTPSEFFANPKCARAKIFLEKML